MVSEAAKLGKHRQLQWSLDVKSRMGCAVVGDTVALDPASMEPRRKVEDGFRGTLFMSTEVARFNGAST